VASQKIPRRPSNIRIIGIINNDHRIVMQIPQRRQQTDDLAAVIMRSVNKIKGNLAPVQMDSQPGKSIFKIHVDEGCVGGAEPVDERDIERLLAEREQNEFVRAEAQLRQAIRESPDLRELEQNLIVEMTPEGMRIQIIDQAGTALFPLGSSQMFDHTRRLLLQVARVVDKLPNEISISGHTDSTPYLSADGYGNWELSTDRANASRRMLIKGGLSPDRIAKVTGKADREHLFPDDPTSPRNRRISMVLLRGTGHDGAGARRAAGPGRQ